MNPKQEPCYISASKRMTGGRRTWHVCRMGYTGCLTHWGAMGKHIHLLLAPSHGQTLRAPKLGWRHHCPTSSFVTQLHQRSGSSNGSSQATSQLPFPPTSITQPTTANCRDNSADTSGSSAWVKKRLLLHSRPPPKSVSHKL